VVDQTLVASLDTANADADGSDSASNELGMSMAMKAPRKLRIPVQNAIVIIHSLRLQTLPSRKPSPCPGHILWHPSRRLGKVL
jgi:hypothetical protein